MDEVIMLLKSITATIDIAKGLCSLNKTTEINKQIAPLLEKLISVEKDANSMVALIRKLEEEKETYRKKLLELENWIEIETQHESIEVIPGIRVQIRKGLNEETTKNAVWNCTNCWSDRKQSPLQFQSKNDYLSEYFCPKCGIIFKSQILTNELLPCRCFCTPSLQVSLPLLVSRQRRWSCHLQL